MLKPLNISCKACGSEATAVMSQYIDAVGMLIQWPKSFVKDDGIYFAINCPNCGEREQLMAAPTTGGDLGD